MALNMQQKFVMVLEVRGFRVVKRGKYIVMGRESCRTNSGRPVFFYVGKSGALRTGINQSSSRPAWDSDKQKLLEEFETLMPPGF